MKIKLLTAVLSVALLITTWLQPAHAQWTLEGSLFQNNSYYGGWVNPYDNTMTQMYQSNMNQITSQAIQNSQFFSHEMSNTIGRGSMGRGSRGRARRLKMISRRERAQADRFAKYRGTMFQEKPSLMPARLAAIFAKSTGTKASEITPAFKALLDVYKIRARQQGAPPNDLARTIAYCTAANYIYFQGGNKNVPESQISALRGKVRVALSESAKFRALSNADKQQMSDTLIILTHLVAYGVEIIPTKVPKEKRAEVKQGFIKLAGVNLKGLLGVDPRRVSFDNSGLVIKAA